MIFLTPTTAHFKEIFKHCLGIYDLEKFHDGELFLKLKTIPKKNEPVTVIAATNAPAQHFFELFFLLNTLEQAEATIHLLFTYFGYARQEHPKPFVAQGTKVICNFFKQFPLNKTTIIHPHSELLHNYLNFTAITLLNIFVPLIKQENIEMIIAPDHGAQKACNHLAQLTGSNTSVVEKKRIGKDQIKAASLQGTVAGKRVMIFDDLTSTGETLIQAAALLKKGGAKKIYAAVTHSLLDLTNAKRILASPIEQLWVTNTIAQRIVLPDFHILDIGPELKKIASL